MDDTETGIVVGVLMFAILSLVVISIAWSVSDEGWRQEAIANGSAQYNPKSGKFELVKAKKSEAEEVKK